MKTRFFVLCLALLSFAFSSCDRDQPTPKYTRAWLSQAGGEQLTFRNAGTGATATLLAQVQDVTHSLAGKFDFRSHDYQVITLTYHQSVFPQAELCQLQFNGDGYLALGYAAPDFTRCALVDTAPKSAQEVVSGTELADAELLNNLVLDGRSYARVVHLRYRQGAWNDLTEYWYSKADGLVAYTRADGQTWYRVH